ncbi:MAG: universal stress protein [Thalassobium sp.]|uniref:universal stress protein n=1 Tax=Octadecabacter sp. SW4 TaxID=2602067 RepID=UPI000C104C0A|nr:universal stress protein [Octadecabacter sp. SW4]PHQ83774.1 MAG: universal stress protein [Thalassobium sp.]QEE34852.1 universal stress protein [Octadecabacter sp. SW4]
MYRNVLVPIAYDSDHDPKAAIEIAKVLTASDGKITLLHVMDEVPAYAMSYMPAGFRDETRVALSRDLAEKAAQLKNATGLVIEGHSGRTILEWAEEHDVDCIVMASHRPGISDYFLGSTAARVVRHAPCAVHVMR